LLPSMPYRAANDAAPLSADASSIA
jgi:hypothetical protein